MADRFHRYICMRLWPRVPILGEVSVRICDWLYSHEGTEEETDED